MVAILPCLEEDQGNYSDSKNKDEENEENGAEQDATQAKTMPKVRRKILLFHDCIEKIFKPMNDAFEKGEKVLCGDGFVRNMKPMVAAWLGDKEEHWVICQNIGVRIQNNSKLSVIFHDNIQCCFQMIGYL